MGSSGTGASGGGKLSAGGGMSLASAGLSAYSSLLQGQGTADADDCQAQKLDTAATYGDLKAVQTGGQMTRNLNNTLSNIAAVRAASGADPSSPTDLAVSARVEAIGDENKSITVDSMLAQSTQERNDAAYYRSAASNALFAGDIGAVAGVAKAVAPLMLGM